MPELTTVSPEPPLDAPVTVTVFPPAPSPVPDLPAPPAELPPAPPALDPQVVTDLTNGINQLNTVLEGGEVAGETAGGVLLLDSVQFGVIGVGLALVVALLAALFVVGLRR